jgi:hypothetical protein
MQFPTYVQMEIVTFYTESVQIPSGGVISMSLALILSNAWVFKQVFYM